jgi:hypothetical protein
MSRRLLSQPRHRAGRFKPPLRSSARSRWPRALAQIGKRLSARSFVLAAWPSRRCPPSLAASGLAVVPSATLGSPHASVSTSVQQSCRPKGIHSFFGISGTRRLPAVLGARSCHCNSPADQTSKFLAPVGVDLRIHFGRVHLGMPEDHLVLQFFCTYCPCQPNAASMRATAGVIVDACKIPEIYVNPVSAQYQTDGRRAGLKIRSL